MNTKKPRPPVRSAPVRVLLVEDDEDDQILVRDALCARHPGVHELIWARDADEAMGRIASDAPDVCLADYRLGGETGVAFLRRLRASGDATPVILVTGNATPGVDREALDAGAFELLDKREMTPETLERAVRYAIARSRLEARLRASEDRYALAIRGSTTIVVDWDLRRDALHLSPNAASILGVGDDKSALTPDAWLDRVHPDDRTTLGLRLEALRESAVESIVLEHRVRSASGRWLVVEARLRRVDEGRDGSRLVGTLQDLTERLRLAELHQERERRRLESRRLESLSVLAGGIAHDFNNLLTAVQGSNQMVRVVLGDAGADTRYADLIDDALAKLTELTHRISLYAGRAPLQPGLLDLNAAITASASRLERIVREVAGDAAVLEIQAADEPLRVEADRAHLELALDHLVRNAAEAVCDSGGLVRITVSRETDDAVVVVSDDGAGMDARTLDRARDPFFSTRFIGRGLGLGAVDGVARAHGGRLEMSSQRGSGTFVRFSLPRADVFQGRGCPGVNVLLHAHDALKGEYFAAALMRADHAVVRVSHADAVNAEAVRNADAVILDAVSPVAELGMLVRTIRAERPDAVVLLLGAPGSEFDVASDPDVEALPYLTPPFTAPALVVLLRELLLAR